uniref:Uncharacterized protein n=1 Tax=Meloidogyne incognita TaxID=6306 RepID=A0A914M711_MELIC
MISTPCVIFIEATPAKWKVFKVICVDGSPIEVAATAPTAVQQSLYELFLDKEEEIAESELN